MSNDIFQQIIENDSVVFNDDCMNIMKHIPDQYYDLAVCDIPYGINVTNMAYLKERKHAVMQKNGTRLSANNKKKQYTPKSWDSITPDQKYFDELKRISKHQIIFGIEYVKWEGVGSGRLKWNKGVAENVSFKSYELAYCSLVEDTIEVDLLWSGMFQAKSIHEPMVQKGNKKLNEKRMHPCYKPVMLYDYIYMLFEQPKMKVIDTHLGGGSNRISAYKYNFPFTGIEIDSEYYADHQKRFKEFISQLSFTFD